MPIRFSFYYFILTRVGPMHQVKKRTMALVQCFMCIRGQANFMLLAMLIIESIWYAGNSCRFLDKQPVAT